MQVSKLTTRVTIDELKNTIIYPNPDYFKKKKELLLILFAFSGIMYTFTLPTLYQSHALTVSGSA